MYLVVGGYRISSTEILVSGDSSWKTVGSYPIYGAWGVRVAYYDNMLLSFGDITFDHDFFQ